MSPGGFGIYGDLKSSNLQATVGNAVKDFSVVKQ